MIDENINFILDKDALISINSFSENVNNDFDKYEGNAFIFEINLFCSGLIHMYIVEILALQISMWKSTTAQDPISWNKK